MKGITINSLTLDYYVKALQSMSMFYLNSNNATERNECRCHLEGMMAAGAEFFVLWKMPISLGWKYPCLDMLETYYMEIQDASNQDRERLTEEALSNFNKELLNLLTPAAKKMLKKEDGDATN